MAVMASVTHQQPNTSDYVVHAPLKPEANTSAAPASRKQIVVPVIIPSSNAEQRFHTSSKAEAAFVTPTYNAEKRCHTSFKPEAPFVTPSYNAEQRLRTTSKQHYNHTRDTNLPGKSAYQRTHPSASHNATNYTPRRDADMEWPQGSRRVDSASPWNGPGGGEVSTRVRSSLPELPTSSDWVAWEMWKTRQGAHDTSVKLQQRQLQQKLKRCQDMLQRQVQ